MLASVGYEPTTKTMEVEYHGGKVYQGPATPEEHEALLKAGSIGQHFAKHLRSKVNRKV